MKHFNLAVVLLVAAMSVTALAATTPVNITNEANATWCGEPYNSIIGCSTYPKGKETYDGAKFDIPTTNNAWFADVAASGGGGTVSVTIPVNIKGVQTVYTLMNVMWGSTESGLLTITFNGSGGVSWTYDMVTGVDLRDYNNGNYLNTIDCALPSGATTGSAGTISAFNNNEGQRLDMQIFQLPTAFAKQTLESITITDNGANMLQRSILAAVSVSKKAP